MALSMVTLFMTKEEIDIISCVSGAKLVFTEDPIVRALLSSKQTSTNKNARPNQIIKRTRRCDGRGQKYADNRAQPDG